MFRTITSILLSTILWLNGTQLSAQEQHVKVQYEEGKYAGWPANWGMWNWGNEILVGYTYADHKDIKGHGHSYNRESAVAKFSRSLDGGLTWKMEDAYASGIRDSTWENHLGNKSANPIKLTTPIDFLKKDFALNLRMRHETEGGTTFYYTYNRGKKWNGPFALEVVFPGPKPVGIVARTSYIIESKNEMTAFLTVAFKNGKKDWRQVACVRTVDGGLTWKHLSWIGDEEINSIMPAAVRLSSNKLITIIRRTAPAAMVSFISEDNGLTWKQLTDPAKVDANGHPPALVKLKDNRLCLVYGIRVDSTMTTGVGIYVTYSANEGNTWSNPRLLRGNDGAGWDIGYPRAILRPDGKVVATYYYNNLNQGDKYRYIAATIFDPNEHK